MWIKRTITAEIKKLVSQFPIIVITGSRQVGKTSLLEKNFPDYTYISLDYPQLAETAETRPDYFLSAYPPPLIIDEIQYAPKLMRYLKVKVDSLKTKGLYILTGSQSFSLMQSITESLAGRAAIIQLYGLSSQEWCAHDAIRQRFTNDDFLWRGSYPGLWSDINSPVSRNRWYESYIATYIERDVRNLMNIGKLRDFERFIRACAARTGQLLNMSEIGRDVGISATTAREWISILAASNIIYLLEPYYRSLGKRLIKSPKLYFPDTGLALFLNGFETINQLWLSPAAGAFWENHVISQWLRWKQWTSSPATLWFWQDQQKNEVDLLIDVNQKLYPIECKLKENPGKKDIRGIKKISNIYGEQNIAQAYIACRTSSPFLISENIMAVNGFSVWDLY